MSKYDELFEPYKGILEDAKIKWSDDKIREFIKQNVEDEESSISSDTTSTGISTGMSPSGIYPNLVIPGAREKVAASDQNAVMDFLGNTLWGATEGGTWGAATGINLATGQKVGEAVSLGYSDPWKEESFAGKAGYILGSSVGALTGFILAGKGLATVGAGRKIGSEALAKLGGLALQKNGANVANKVLAGKLFETVQKEVGGEFFERIVGTAANDVLKIGKGWWWNNTLRKQTLTMANRPFSSKIKRAISRKDLTDEGVANLQKTIFNDLKKKGLATEVRLAESLSRGLAREAFNVASKYNSKNLNMAFAAMYSKGGTALGSEAGAISKSAQLLAAGTAEALVFGVHTLGQHLFTNMGYNVFSKNKRVVNGAGEDLTAMEVIKGLTVSLVTGAALGPMRFTGKGKITGQEVVQKYKTWTDKALDPVTVEQAVKLGILKKDLPAFFASIKRQIFPRRYNTDTPLGQEAIIAKANMLMKMSEDALITKLPKGLLVQDLIRLPGKSATSEKSLKEIAKLSVTFLKNVEKSYNKEVGPWLLSEMGRDIWNSLGRMTRGSIIMNAEAFHHNLALTDSIWGDDPRETIAHILTGMFFTKRKHTFIGGDKTTYYDMARYRKYMDSLEILGYDTAEMAKFKALLGTSRENAKEIMIASNPGVNAMNKALSGEDGRSFLLTKEQQAAKDADAANEGKILYKFSSYVANDKELNKEEKIVIENIYEAVETGLATRLHYGGRIGLISKSEYNTIKKNLLSKDMNINGHKLNAENSIELVLHALDEATNDVTKIYKNIVTKFHADIANILNVRRDAKNMNIVSMDEGIKSILENMKTSKFGSPSDNRRIQETGALVLEAVNLAKSWGLIKLTPKTKGLVTEIDSEKSEQIESALATALESLHNLQFGNARTGEWRSESFGGILKDRNNKKFMLQDRFADIHMLSQSPLYEGINTGMLWARNLLGEKLFSMDLMLESDMKMNPADRDVLGEIHTNIKDKFKDGPISIVEEGITSASPLNKVLERMYRAHELEHPNKSKTEGEVNTKEAKEFIDEVERHVGDLFRSEESFEPFMRYLESTSIDRIYSGSTRFTYGARAALVTLINSELNVVKGVTIYLPTRGSVKKAILAHEKLDSKKKSELIEFYDEWYNESENAGRLQKSEVDTEFKDLDMLVDTIGQMELRYNKQKWADHIKEIDKFRMSMLGVSKQLDVLDIEVTKALDEAKKAFDRAVKNGVQVDSSEADIKAFKDKQELVSNLRDQQLGIFTTYERALNTNDWVVLNSLLGSNITKTIEDLKRDLSVNDADLSKISIKYLKKRGQVILNAIEERNKIFSKTGMEYNKIVDSKASGIDEFTGVKHDDAVINWSKFGQKYGLSGAEMDNMFSLHRGTFKILTDFVAQNKPGMQPLLSFFEGIWKTNPGRSSFVIEELFKVQPDFLEVFGEFITNQVVTKNTEYNNKATTKKANHRKGTYDSIIHEVMTLMRAELQMKKIGTMSWENGKLIEDVGTYAHSDKGVSGMFDRLRLKETNSVFIFTEKSVDGRVMSLLTPELITYMNQQMAKGKIDIENFADLKQSVHKDIADNVSESTHIGFGESGKPQPFIMTLDGKTHLIVMMTDMLNIQLRKSLRKNSSLRNELETILKDSQGKITSKKAKDYLNRLDKNLNMLREPQEGQPVDRIIREAFYLSRLIIDSPIDLRTMILTGEGIPNEHKLYKYVATLSPKGVPVNKATLLGARGHIDVMKKQFKKNTEKWKQWNDLEERIINATGPDRENSREANIVTVLDERAVENTPDGSREFLDVHSMAKARAELENHKVFQDENGNFSESKFDEIHQDLKKASKSSVDGEMFVSLDMMATLLFARGEGLNAFQFNKGGKIIGVNWGAVKPNIWHSKVDVKTGEIVLFTGKTAIKYRPRFDHFFENKNVDAIMFESANKFNKRIPSFGGKEEERSTQLSLNSLLSDNKNKKMYQENNWEKLLLQGLNQYGDFSKSISKIPYSSFLLRSTAREHDAVLSRATFTFLDERSLSDLSKWIGQDHNLRVAQDMLSLARDFNGLNRVARFLNEKKEIGEVSNELVDAIVGGGHAMPISLQGTINQQIMSALNRAGNFTSVANEGAYSVMSAGNHLSYAIKKDGEVIKFGGSGISHYAANKEVNFIGKLGEKRATAIPSIIVTVGGEDFIIGRDLSGFEILNRGRTVKEKDIELGTLVLRELGLDQYLGNQIVGGYELYTQGHKKAVALIVKEILAGTYKDMQDLKRVKETLNASDIIAWLDGVDLANFKHNQDVRIKNGIKSQSDIRNTILKEKLTSVIEDIIKHREKLIKKASTQEQKKSLRDADNWAELKERIKRDGVLKFWKDKTTGSMKDRIVEGMWLTKIDLRIPKDSIEGMLLTKTEKILSKSRGSVSEMNGADAILIQDADFDLDKSVEWWGMPWSMVKNFNQVSGYVKYPSISEKSKMFDTTGKISMLGDVDNELRQRMGADKVFGKVRAGIISSHHLISFLANLAEKSEAPAIMRELGLRAGEGEGFIKPKHGFGVPFGEEVKQLTLGEWQGADRMTYRINLAATSDFINATHSMKEWLKLVMDVDKATRADLSKMSQDAILNHIFFNAEAGFFQLTRQSYDKPITRVKNWSSVEGGLKAQQQIRDLLLSPMRDLFSLMGGDVMMEGGVRRDVLPYDYADVLGRVRRDLFRLKDTKVEGIDFSNAASFLLNSLADSKHPYLKTLREFSNFSSKDWLRPDMDHPLADLIFTKTQEALFGDYEKIQTVAARYINNQRIALDLNTIDWAIKSIEHSMNYFSSLVTGDAKDLDNLNIHAKEWRRYKKDLDAKVYLRETLSYALTYDISAQDIGKKLSNAGQIWGFLKNEGQGPSQVTVDSNKYKVPVLIYRGSPRDITKSRFEMVQPGETSNMFVKPTDAVLINPRRFEYVQNAEQQGLQAMFRAFARRVDGINPFHQDKVREIADNMVREIKETYFDSHGGVDFKNKSTTDWQRYEVKILEIINQQFKIIEQNLQSEPDMVGKFQEQLIYEILRPDVDTNAFAVVRTVDSNNQPARKYLGQKYFNNHTGQKAILKWLNNIANGSRMFNNGQVAQGTNSTVMTPERAKKLFHKVMDLYTQHSRNVYDSFLPSAVANVKYPATWKSKRETGFLPKHEASDWILQGKLSAGAEAGIFADYLLGLHVMSPNMLYDLSLKIGKQLANSAMSEKKWVIEMAKGGTLGDIISNVWRKEATTVNRYGKKVASDAYEGVISYYRRIKSHRGIFGREQNNTLTEQSIEDKFNCLTKK